MTTNRYTDNPRSRQLLSFHNLRWGRASFTDIDAILEIRNKGYVIIEAKSAGVELLKGQQIALDRLHNDLSHTGKSGKEVLSIVCRHDTDADVIVDLGGCLVTAYRTGSQWTTDVDLTGLTVKGLVDWWLAEHGFTFD